MTMLVRLKPHNPKRGHLLRSYTAFGLRFLADRGWYEVDDSTAAYLATIKQDSTDPHGIEAFDVCTQEEAEAIDVKEEAAARKASMAPAVSPNQGAPKRVHAKGLRPMADTGTLTTADLPGNKPSFDAEPDNFSDDMTAPDAPPESPRDDMTAPDAPPESPPDESANDAEDPTPKPAPARRHRR